MIHSTTDTRVHSIYIIRNSIDGKMYVGRTNNAERRKSGHFRTLKQGKHHSSKLQSAYDQYGRKAFTFTVIERGLCDTDACNRETFFIAIFDTVNTGYNMIPGEGIIDETFNYSHTDYHELRTVNKQLKDVNTRLLAESASRIKLPSDVWTNGFAVEQWEYHRGQSDNWYKRYSKIRADFYTLLGYIASVDGFARGVQEYENFNARQDTASEKNSFAQDNDLSPETREKSNSKTKVALLFVGALIVTLVIAVIAVLHIENTKIDSVLIVSGAIVIVEILLFILWFDV